ncbi:TrmB family transcriptional regulator [candidate division WOR-3 bacterium]|nr:TrmB family transcriptional regulator [candidate division WOR-3 bacterium]
MREIISDLQRTGLTLNEAKAYFTLLGRESYTASELSVVSGIPRQKSYPVLESLVEKGLCICEQGKVRRFRAVPPATGFKNLLIRQEREQEEKGKLTEILIEKLSPMYKAGAEDPLRYVEFIRDPSYLKQRFIELVSGCKKELLAWVKPPYVLGPEENRYEVKALKRGIKKLAIYECSSENIGALKEDIKELHKAGEESRIIDNLPMKLAIFDKFSVLYALEDPVSGRELHTSMLIKHPNLAITLKDAFNHFWQLSKPIF